MAASMSLRGVTTMKQFSSRFKALATICFPGYKKYSTDVSKAVLPQQVFLDTNATVKTLETAGFTRHQSDCITSLLVLLLTRETEMTQRDFVSKANQEITVQHIMSSIHSLKKDMVILEKTEFTLLRSESEKLALEVAQLKTHLKDEIQKVSNNVTLDINLERARSKEASSQALQQVDHCRQEIKTESANMMAKLEASKTDVLKYFAGSILGCLTLSLAVFRIFKS
ncbi:putative mitochondrial calcium uniporter regulator 1 isoform X2 [Apostichopus japonicus]|uniref:Putative mitochondrial calcium uniporter regulator 1 isoform X2 n=1 Tax=Stichopus japonicus TaxID=307972 RepID=A0A2G8KBZ0_STIJA|nr:putative mitochondrial calcium uniporter regulator 1 isoform X2 [Apostichopus japonicus]